MINEELKELQKPNCAMDCGGFYADYDDPTGVYSHGKVEEVLVDPRADMFIKRLLAYIDDQKKFVEELSLAAVYNPSREI